MFESSGSRRRLTAPTPDCMLAAASGIEGTLSWFGSMKRLSKCVHLRTLMDECSQSGAQCRVTGDAIWNACQLD